MYTTIHISSRERAASRAKKKSSFVVTEPPLACFETDAENKHGDDLRMPFERTSEKCTQKHIIIHLRSVRLLPPHTALQKPSVFVRGVEVLPARLW